MGIRKLLLCLPASEGGTRRAHVLQVLVLALGALIEACVSDTTLLQENAAVALRCARFQARSDLVCPNVALTIESEKEVPGAPWGYLWSDYRIRAEGCGRIAFYDAKCRDEQLCKITLLPR